MNKQETIQYPSRNPEYTKRYRENNAEKRKEYQKKYRERKKKELREYNIVEFLIVGQHVKMTNPALDGPVLFAINSTRRETRREKNEK